MQRTENPTIRKIFPFLQWLPEVNRQSIRADLMAGLTGAVIVIPQGVAFAMIAGMPPIYGLYTAMITPIVAALFGSSKHLISGPTTAISIVVFAAISKFAEPGSADFVRLALTLTFLAGVFQFALGLARMGTLVNFVSHVVVIGFTAGAALLIGVSQLKHVFGIAIPSGSTFLETMTALVTNLNEINWAVLAVAGGTLGSALLIKRIWPRSPYMLPAMVIGSLMGLALGGEANGIRLVGKMPAHLPPFSVPDLSFKTINQLVPNAFAIALLGLIEAVAIARSIATRTHQQIDGNQEFIGQGLSNIVGSFFSSYAGSGSFTRSGINHQAGAQTPLAAIFAALMLMAILLLIAPLTAYLPIPAMGGIILLVAYNLIDFHHIGVVIKASKRQTTVLAITFLATLFFDLEFAIYFGVLFSLFFYLRRTSSPNIAVMAPDPSSARRQFHNLERVKLQECPQLKILRVDGSIFFGATFNIANTIRDLTESSGEKHLLIVANGVNFIDVAGSEWLVQEAQRFRMMGGGLYISGLKAKAEETLVKGGYKDQIGNDHFFRSKEEAIARLTPILDGTICAGCTKRVFRECAQLPGGKEFRPKNEGA